MKAAWSVSLAVALVLAACGGSTPPPVENPPVPVAAAPSSVPTAAPTGAVPTLPTGAPRVTPPAAPGSFFAMSDAQKLDQMRKVVKPSMGKLFTAFDPKKFGEFSCRTCHGPDGKQDPQKVLPKLTLSGDGFKKLFGEKPAMMKFMTEQVAPAMATAMGEPPFDPATKKGFGCGGCHTVN